MKILKNIVSQLHTFLLWLVVSVIFWSWIFTLITDAPPAEKVTVYCHVPGIQDTALAAALEEHMPEGLRMIKVHSFEYVVFDVESIGLGDIFIIPASELGTYGENFVPVGDEPGVKVYDAAAGTGAAMTYIRYEEANEDFYLFLGAGSVHLEDGKALEVARELLAIK